MFCTGFQSLPGDITLDMLPYIRHSSINGGKFSSFSAKLATAEVK